MATNRLGTTKRAQGTRPGEYVREGSRETVADGDVVSTGLSSIESAQVTEVNNDTAERTVGIKSVSGGDITVKVTDGAGAGAATAIDVFVEAIGQD